MVSLPLGGFIEITFINNVLTFSEIFFSSATINGISYTFTSSKNTANSTFTFRHTATIARYSEIQISFRFRAPGKVGDYEILTLRTFSSAGL